jgi:hypothetical protein
MTGRLMAGETPQQQLLLNPRRGQRLKNTREPNLIYRCKSGNGKVGGRTICKRSSSSPPPAKQ